MQINALIYAPSHRFSTFAPLHLQGLDVIPEGVSDVLSYFFPSKLQHLLLTDVISLFSETTIDAHFAATAHVMKVALAAAAAADALTSAPPPTSTTTTAIDSNKDNERSMLDETNCLNPSPPPPPTSTRPGVCFFCLYPWPWFWSWYWYWSWTCPSDRHHSNGSIAPPPAVPGQRCHDAGTNGGLPVVHKIWSSD